MAFFYAVYQKIYQSLPCTVDLPCVVFRTLFAKDASIQIGISLLLVLQHDLPKFVAVLDYTVPNIHKDNNGEI